MSEELPEHEPGAEVWVSHRNRWRRGTVHAAETGRVQVEFTPPGAPAPLLRWFTTGADPVQVMAGTYAAPVKWRCLPCGVSVWGTPGQPGEQAWAAHAALAAHQAHKKSTPRMRRRIADLVSPERLLWVSRERSHVIAHPYRPGAELTDCRLTQAGGTTITAQDAVNQYRAQPCNACRWES